MNRNKTAYVGWKLRMLIINRDKGCRLCGKRISYCTGSAVKGNSCWRAYSYVEGKLEAFHFEHIRPVSKCGNSEFSNLRLLCAYCNLSRGNLYE